MIEVQAPEYPHFIHMQTSNIGTPILKTDLLVLCENPDPTTGNGKYPMRLVGCRKRELVFVCGCGDRLCTKKYVFRGHETGRHPVKVKDE